MKKYGKIVLLIAFVCILLMIGGYKILEQISGNSSTDADNQISLVFDSNGNYTGFDSAHFDDTCYEAIENGCLVLSNGMIVGGTDNWNRFLSSSKAKYACGIRIAYFNEGEKVFYKDLLYEDQLYHIFSSDSDSKKDVSYDFLLQLNGVYSDTVKELTFTVLTNENNLSFDEIKTSLTAKDLDQLQAIPEYQLLFTKQE